MPPCLPQLAGTASTHHPSSSLLAWCEQSNKTVVDVKERAIIISTELNPTWGEPSPVLCMSTHVTSE